tara:strand:- start:1094 stop:1420 length:327 start_codon:yes stop_codon:yes gene_type:complete
MRIDPDYADDAYNNRGMAHFELENYENAIANFTNCLIIDPNDARAYTNRGEAYGGLGNYEDAITDFTIATRIDPDYARAYYDRGTKQRSSIAIWIVGRLEGISIVLVC